MFGWFVKGAASRVKTTRYPALAETARGTTPGRPIATALTTAPSGLEVAAKCPTGAITASPLQATLDMSRCVHCLACARGENRIAWAMDYRWATWAGDAARRTRPPRAFQKSLHIRVVDTGSCDAVITEIKQLAKPYYNMHRLGFFITPTPRHADVLMVTGPVTSQMRLALRKTYAAMPEPKWVIAVGNCAITGCVFAPSFVASGSVAEVIPVDVQVPGCPPPPLAILHGLLLLTGRETEMPMTDQPGGALP
jgi:Ni,Fe-hydrogenase III small subunit